MSTTIVPVIRSYGDLIVPGVYTLHSHFTHAVNFIDGDSLVSIVDQSVGAGPLNIALNTIPECEIGTLKIGNDSIFINGLSLILNKEQRYDSRITLPDKTDHGVLQANLELFKKQLLTHSPRESLSFLLAPVPQIKVLRFFENVLRNKFNEGAELLRQGRLPEGVAQIKGLGHGLTPQGDDFIAGMLFALHLRERVFKIDVQQSMDTMYTAAESGNPFSKAFLNCARQGRAFGRLKTLIMSLFDNDVQEIEIAARELLAIGETSGADLGAGLVFGMEHLRTL